MPHPKIAVGDDVGVERTLARGHRVEPVGGRGATPSALPVTIAAPADAASPCVRATTGRFATPERTRRHSGIAAPPPASDELDRVGRRAIEAADRVERDPFDERPCQVRGRVHGRQPDERETGARFPPRCAGPAQPGEREEPARAGVDVVRLLRRARRG